MPEFKQKRPQWCPNKDCMFKIIVQELICGGKLPKPLEHNGDYNTHRLCFRGDGGVNDLQVNFTDLYHIKRIIEVLSKDANKNKPVTIEIGKHKFMGTNRPCPRCNHSPVVNRWNGYECRNCGMRFHEDGSEVL